MRPQPETVCPGAPCTEKLSFNLIVPSPGMYIDKGMLLVPSLCSITNITLPDPRTVTVPVNLTDVGHFVLIVSTLKLADTILAGCVGAVVGTSVLVGGAGTGVGGTGVTVGINGVGVGIEIVGTTIVMVGMGTVGTTNVGTTIVGITIVGKKTVGMILGAVGCTTVVLVGAVVAVAAAVVAVA